MEIDQEDEYSKKSSFNKLESYFSDTTNLRITETPDKTAEYYSKNIMPTYTEFEKDFIDKKTGIEFALSFGDFSKNWYGDKTPFSFDLAKSRKAKWDDQLLFVRARKKSREKFGVPSIGDSFNIESDSGMMVSFNVSGSFFDNDKKRATGYIIASNFKSFPLN